MGLVFICSHHAISLPLDPAIWETTWPVTSWCLQSGALVSLLCCWCAPSPSSLATESIPGPYQHLYTSRFSPIVRFIADVDWWRTLPTDERVLSHPAVADGSDVLSPAAPSPRDTPGVLVHRTSRRSSWGPRWSVSGRYLFLHVGISTQGRDEDDEPREVSENP